MDLSRTKDMSSWQQVKVIVFIQIMPLPIGQRNHLGLGSAVAFSDQRMRALGTENRLMLRKVISVRVRDERHWLGTVRVEPQVQVWQVETTSIADLDRISRHRVLRE